jgi:hypothetical protein
VPESLGNSFRLLVAAALVAGALGAFAALLLLATGSLFEGLLTAAVTLFTFRGFWQLSRRKRELLKRGYVAGHRIGTHWVYEELHGREIVSLELPLDYVGRGEYEVHVPGAGDWLATMPEWARQRRVEIVERLTTVFKRSQMHFDPDTRPES